jgi:hypothetical protein
VGGKTSLSPFAPALAQSRASSLIMETGEWTEGWLPWNMQSFRCFQIIEGVSSAAKASPLRSSLGVCCLACNHQSMSVLTIRCSCCHPEPSKHFMPDNLSERAFEHQVAHCFRCLVAERASTVQHMSKFASQWKNLTRGGAHVFQISFQEWQVTDPWKVARYAEWAE